ncbi:MAG TPA: carbon storage regulator, partial [Thermosulfurimonas dismutans]|nr:carbon storage regulator [Thermosulfurimonas dismutans]
MLVLTRKPGEALLVNGSIEIQVLEVKGKQVKLGIVAPPEVHILRKELFERIREENL